MLLSYNQEWIRVIYMSFDAYQIRRKGNRDTWERKKPEKNGK